MLGLWLQCVLIVKIWRLRVNDTFAALAAFYQRGVPANPARPRDKAGIAPVWVTSFGTAVPIPSAVDVVYLGYQHMDGYSGEPGTDCHVARPYDKVVPGTDSHVARPYGKVVPGALLYDLPVPTHADIDWTFDLYTLQCVAQRALYEL
jgi:hypothetical protein